MSAWEMRLGSAAIVGAGLALLHAAVADPVAREGWLMRIGLPIGYGHLLGGWLFARARRPRVGLETAARVVLMLTAFCVYTRALAHPALGLLLVAPMLVVSAWHVLENDRALASALLRGAPPAPLSLRPRAHLVSALGTAGLAAAALATPSGALYVRWLADFDVPLRLTTIPDLAALVLIYHAVTWLLFSMWRARTLPPRSRARRVGLLLGVHALPVALGELSVAFLPAVHALYASAPLYLFWSVAHALQTAAARGLGPR